MISLTIHYFVKFLFDVALVGLTVVAFYVCFIGWLDRK